MTLEVSWWDIFVVEVSLLCQWYLTKLVGEIFLWHKWNEWYRLQLIQVMRVRLAHLRVNFQIICCGYDSGHLRGHFFSRSHIKWPTIGTHSATKINHCYRFVQIKLKVCYQSLVRIFTISIYLFLATILSLQVAIGTFLVKK